MCDSGNLLQIKFARLANQQLIQPPIFAQNKGVVQIGDQQNILHAKRHQPFETLKRVLRVKNQLGLVKRAHSSTQSMQRVPHSNLALFARLGWGVSLPRDNDERDHAAAAITASRTRANAPAPGSINSKCPAPEISTNSAFSFRPPEVLYRTYSSDNSGGTTSSSFPTKIHCRARGIASSIGSASR